VGNYQFIALVCMVPVVGIAIGMVVWWIRGICRMINTARAWWRRIRKRDPIKDRIEPRLGYGQHMEPTEETNT
jgi:uncharacterized iron-regulated membrane protein